MGLGNGVGAMKGGGVGSGRGSESGVVVQKRLCSMQGRYGIRRVEYSKGRIRNHESRFEV